MSRDEEGHNGWANYPTWAVNLWLSNDEPLYRQTRWVVASASGGETERVDVADALKSWVSEDLVPDLGGSMAADLLGYALELVDWLEIADAWLSER